jgi:UDP-glucuronate decarboxylase
MEQRDRRDLDRRTPPRLLVTGGTGFFGRALLRFLRDRERWGGAVPSVVVLSRSPEAFFDRFPIFGDCRWLRLVAGNILDPRSLPNGEPFTHVLHGAADSTLGPTLAPRQRFDQIVIGTRHLLDYAVTARATQFLFLSSGGVYGRQPAELERIPESYCGAPDATDPASAYGMGKRAAEHLCALYAAEERLPVVIARCFAFVGIDLPLDVHFAIGNFIRDALWRESIEVASDGTALRSYLDQRDLAQWLWTLLVEAVPGRVYNVGSDVAISIAELAMLVQETLAPGKLLHIRGTADPATPRHRYVPDISRIRAELGVEVTVPLVEAIRRVGTFHRGGGSG